MKYAQLRTMDVTNGPGIGVAFFVQGCERNCKNCFNPETHDFGGGKEFTPETLQLLLMSINEPYVKRLSILGGEPLHPKNLFLTMLICKTVREKYPEKKIYIWTGYTMEELRERNDSKINSILNGTYADVLIDGPFIDELKDFTLEYRGSSNQKIYNLKHEN